MVTDLGTEFGVEVGKEGTTTSHVFRGSVKVRLVAGGPTARQHEVVLRENESARWRRSRAGGLRLVPHAADISAKFTRRLIEPPKLLDLLDIVAGGDGTGHHRECGIDATTGLQDPAFIANDRGRRRPIPAGPWQKLIDGVFIPDGGRAGSCSTRRGTLSTASRRHRRLRAARFGPARQKFRRTERAQGPARLHLRDGAGQSSTCRKAAACWVSPQHGHHV